jgi:hypothetical protein
MIASKIKHLVLGLLVSACFEEELYDFGVAFG